MVVEEEEEEKEKEEVEEEEEEEEEEEQVVVVVVVMAVAVAVAVAATRMVPYAPRRQSQFGFHHRSKRRWACRYYISMPSHNVMIIMVAL